MNELINNSTRVTPKKDDGLLLATNHPFRALSDINYYIMPNIVIDSILGFAVGDAFGVPVEFLNRNKVRELNLKDMVTGIHNVPKGSWSDDTSMVIAGMDSILNLGEIDYEDIMNNYIKIIEDGSYTSLGYAFDVGATITKALNNYKKNMSILESGCTGIYDNGNGSLMRILPFSLYCIINNIDRDNTREIINKASSLTHAHDISKMGCYIYTEFLRCIICTKNCTKAFEYILNIDYNSYSSMARDAYSRLLDKSFANVKDDCINSTGYVVDTLESVIYCILNSNSYEESILKAVNLGNDTDTIAGITGSISSILYGNIPDRWLDVLSKKDYLIELANNFNIALRKKGKVKKYGQRS